MIQIDNEIYTYSPMGWILCGIVQMGIDGEYIDWFE